MPICARSCKGGELAYPRFDIHALRTLNLPLLVYYNAWSFTTQRAASINSNTTSINFLATTTTTTTTYLRHTCNHISKLLLHSFTSLYKIRIVKHPSTTCNLTTNPLSSIASHLLTIATLSIIIRDSSVLHHDSGEPSHPGCMR